MTDLTPIEIERQEFKVVWRGYDPTEVRAFLGQIAHQLTSLVRTQERAAEELELQSQRLRQVEDYEDRLRDALLAASQLGEQTREDARREADLLVREAELRAEQLLQEGHQAQRLLLNETHTLKRQQERLSAELRSVIESHLRVLENQEEHLKSAQQRWEREEREWDQRWSETRGEYRPERRAEPAPDALSEARELTLTLGAELEVDLDEPTSARAKPDAVTPLLTPSIPEPLTNRSLADSVRPLRATTSKSTLDSKIPSSELGSGVAKLQQVLSATPSRLDSTSAPQDAPQDSPQDADQSVIRDDDVTQETSAISEA